MRPPAFRLERVLRVRRRELDHASVALAMAEAELATANAEANEAADALRVAERGRERRLAGGLRAGVYRAEAIALDSTRRNVMLAREHESLCEARRDEAHGALLSARMRTRALESLQDRRAIAERAFMDKLAQAELDEAALRPAGHPNRARRDNGEEAESR